MLSIAIYSDDTTYMEEFKSMVEDCLIELNFIAKVSSFSNKQSMLTVPASYDIYFMDMDTDTDTIELGKQMMEIDNGSHFIYISSNAENAYKSSKIFANAFLDKPISSDTLMMILKKVRSKVKEENIVIKVSNGERRIRISTLNYVDIVKRCLCYHLKDGAVFDGQVLRSSFEKAITPLQNNPVFFFLSPSLLINLGEIEEIYGDHLVFENGEVLYFPKKHHDAIRERWVKYHLIVN